MTKNNDNDSVEISVSLGVDDKTRHWLYFRQSPRSEQERSKSIHKTELGGASASAQVQVHNGRSKEGLTLDDASFEIVDCPTALRTEDFYAMQDTNHPKSHELKDRYYGEVADFVKRSVGCDKVVVFHHQVRSEKGGSGVQGYAGGAPHTDSSPISADELALTMSKGEDQDEKPYKRYMYLNLWRNISDEHPVKNDHLAVLDERTTVKPDDYIVKDLFMDSGSSVQYNLNARHASNHKWYYFPGMVKEEAILFKQMDSDWTKPGRICFHMSVHHGDDDAQNSNPRESIEARMMCFWNESDSGVESMPTEENMNVKKMQDPTQLASVGGSLDSASSWQLLKTLLGRLFFGLFTTKKSIQASTFSGNAKDYAGQFTTLVSSFPSFPKFAQDWATGEMKKGKDAIEGINRITKALVDDALGYQGTKNFNTAEKKAIVDHLMANEMYLEAAKQHFAKFANTV